MGSWNATCAISQLPILMGEPALLVLIQQSLYPDICESDGRDMLGGTNSMWSPRALPLRGTYDGYGGLKVADAEHWTAQLALHRFRLDVVERDTGTRNAIQAIQEPEVKINDILNGRDLHGEAATGIQWLQHLIIKDRLRVNVPKWLDSEQDREKKVSAVLIRADIYNDLAIHFLDDGHGKGRSADFTARQVREAMRERNQRRRKRRKGEPQIDPTMDEFIKPRMLGNSRALFERTRDLLKKSGVVDGPDPLDEHFSEAMESMERQRLRDPPEKFAEDYAVHLLEGGVEWGQIENIIAEVAAFTHVQLHMGMLNKFWHPQPQGQEGWMSHAAIAMRAAALAKQHSKEPA